MHRESHFSAPHSFAQPINPAQPLLLIVTLPLAMALLQALYWLVRG